jgi:acetyl esterase/lipase
MVSFSEFIEELILSSQMEKIAIVYAILSVVIFLIVLISFSILGLALSEFGLFFAWAPLLLIIVAIPVIFEMYIHAQVLEINIFYITIGLIANIFSFMGAILPFLKVSSINQFLASCMREGLGNNYLDELEDDLNVRFFHHVQFQLRHYFSGITERTITQSINIYKGITYKMTEKQKLQLNVYEPKREGLFPVIVFIHGGAWVIGHKDRSVDEKTCKLLANFGYVVYNINYRLLLTEVNAIPDMLSDIRSAIKFAKENAPAFNGDPERIFVFGRSAGAHLALLSTFTKDGPYFEPDLGMHPKKDLSVKGVIVFYPPTDLKKLYTSFHSIADRTAMEKIIGGKPEDNVETYQLFSPINYITEENASNIPPVFIAQGMNDRMVHPDQSIKLHERLRKFNVTSVLLKLPTANHGFDRFLTGLNGQLVYKYLTQFLAWVISKEDKKKKEAVKNKEKKATKKKENTREKKKETPLITAK